MAVGHGRRPSAIEIKINLFYFIFLCKKFVHKNSSNFFNNFFDKNYHFLLISHTNCIGNGQKSVGIRKSWSNKN